MKSFLNVVGLLALLSAGGILLASKSAFQETTGVITLLVAVTCFGFAAMLSALSETRSEIKDLKKAVDDHALTQRNFLGDARTKFEIK